MLDERPHISSLLLVEPASNGYALARRSKPDRRPRATANVPALHALAGGPSPASMIRTVTNPEPSIHVETGYEPLCEALSEGGWDTIPRWRELAEFRGQRPGWRFALYNSDRGLSASWVFPDDAALLIVDGEMEGFRVFDYIADASHVEPTIDRLRMYLMSVEEARDDEGTRRAAVGRELVRRHLDGRT